MFKKVGGSATGYINSDDIVRGLALLGYPAALEKVALEFREFDYDRDGRMNYKEFSRFMSYKLRNSIYRIDHLIDEIRRQFKKVHPSDGQVFDINQFCKAIENVNLAFDDKTYLKITQPEFEAVFYDVDQDKTGMVELEDFLAYIKKKPDDSESPLVSNFIIKLQQKHVVKLSVLETIFRNAPKHFCISFTRNNFLEPSNLPSDSLAPKLMSNTLGYFDLYGEFADPKTGNVYPTKPLPSEFIRLVTLELATGIPIPTSVQEAEKNKHSIGTHLKSRDMRVVLFDRDTQKFVGGTLIFPAIWKSEYEDRWFFEETGFDCSFYLKFYQQGSNLCLVFEFVLNLEVDGANLQVSSGWCSIDLDNMLTINSEELALHGGAPHVSTQIKTTDVKTGRTTFMGKVGKLFSSDIKSLLKIKILKVDRSKTQVFQALDLLPRTIIVPTESLYLWRALRCYLGRNVNLGSGEVNTNLANDLVVKTFLRAINVGSLHRKLAQIWAADAEPLFYKKGALLPNFDLMAAKVEEIMNISHPLFDSVDFRFNKTDATREYYTDPEKTTRDRIAVQALQRIKEKLKTGKVTTRDNESKFDRAFAIEELLDDDFDQIGGCT